MTRRGLPAKVLLLNAMPSAPMMALPCFDADRRGGEEEQGKATPWHCNLRNGLTNKTDGQATAFRSVSDVKRRDVNVEVVRVRVLTLQRKRVFRCPDTELPMREADGTGLAYCYSRHCIRCEIHAPETSPSSTHEHSYVEALTTLPAVVISHRDRA